MRRPRRPLAAGAKRSWPPPTRHAALRVPLTNVATRDVRSHRVLSSHRGSSTEKFVQGDGLVAVRAGTSGSDAAKKGRALAAVLPTHHTDPAAVALVDGPVSALRRSREDERQTCCAPTRAVGSRAVRIGAVLLATGRREWIAADRAGHRDGHRDATVVHGAATGADPVRPRSGSNAVPLRQTPQTMARALRMQWPSAFMGLLPAARLRS